MRRILLPLLLAFIQSLSTAQTGDFLLSNHEPNNHHIDNTNYDILIDQKGQICLANRSGVIKFDGNTWEYFSTPSAALSLAVDSHDSLFVGCLGMFGKITFRNNREVFVPLYESEGTDVLFEQAIHFRGGILFVSKLRACYYKNNQTYCVDGDFNNFYVQDDELFVNLQDQSTYQITSTKIIPQSTVGAAMSKIVSSPSNLLNIGMDLSGGLFLLDSLGRSFLPQNRLAYTRQLTITDVDWVNDTLFACATAENGIALFNIKDPEFIEITDYQSGLPDNEVYAITTDEEGGIWAAHEYGITRISPAFPAYSYSNFPGWDGNLIQVKEIKNKLWINTSLGIYYLKRDTSFQEQIYYVDPPKNKKKGKSLLDKFKNAVFNSDGQIRMVDKIPIGFNYRFEQVPGSSGKYKQLFDFNQQIIAVSNSGVYEISQEGIKLAIAESVQFAYPIPEKNQLVLSNKIGQVKLYQKRRNYWIEIASTPLNELVVNIYQDENDHLWFAGSSGIYEGVPSDTAINMEAKYKLANQYFDNVSITSFEDRMYFVTSKGFYYLDSADTELQAAQELNTRVGEVVEHIENDAGEIWIFNGKIWYRLSSKGISEFKFLGIFPNLRYVSQNPKSREYWLITSENELLKYTSENIEEFTQRYPIYLKSVSATTGELPPTSNLEFTYEDNQIAFELVKPDYLGILHPEYQYKVDGLMNEWSDWSSNNRFDFNYLPPGAYTLRVRTQDSFGSLEEASPIAFRVRAPYWQQPWFYLIQIVLLGALVVYISKISDQNKYNRLLKGALTVMVLVFVIEFFQSVISAYVSVESTPVIDFMIDASIALLIFPIEFFLRRLMLESDLSKELPDKLKRLKKRTGGDLKKIKPVDE